MILYGPWSLLRREKFSKLLSKNGGIEMGGGIA